MKIVITDVTNLKEQICVAGWCEEEGRMVRPLQGAGGHHWPVEMADPAMFQLGNIVRIEPSGQETDRPPPHAREDLIVAGAPVLVETVPRAILSLRLAPSCSRGVDALFRQCLEERHFVREGSPCPSLGAIGTGARQIGFHVRERENRPPQLRAWFYDGVAEKSYDFPVSSRSLQELWMIEGMDAVNALGMGRRRAHIRIGLASAYPQDQCYAMVNNVLYY